MQEIIQSSHVQLTQFPPLLPFCNTMVEYHNQDISIDTIYQSYSDPILSILICMYTCVCVLSHHHEVKILNSHITTRIRHVALV